MLLKHVCEVCGREETLDSEEAYKAGWDYPPRMGAFGVVSPRTCGSCQMKDTVWWAIAAEGKREKDLTEKQLRTLERIAGEPESIQP